MWAVWIPSRKQEVNKPRLLLTEHQLLDRDSL
jgi:hypothetical protein